MWSPREYYKNLRQPALGCETCRDCCVSFSQGCQNDPVLTPREIEYYKITNPGIIAGNRLASADNGDCLCYDKAGNKCTIYEDRPLDCRIYPLVSLGNALTVDLACSDYKDWVDTGTDRGKFMQEILRLLREESVLYSIELHKASVMYGAGFSCELLSYIR